MQNPNSPSAPPVSFEKETSASEFADERIRKRFRKIVEQLSQGVGQSIPLACQDWANTKAAYRFFSNPRVSEKEILAGHFASTGERIKQVEGRVLMIHDTTEFSYLRQNPQAIGMMGNLAWLHSRRLNTICGIFMHSSLALTPEGVPLGLGAVKIWTRKQFKGCNALKRRINPTRIPIEQKESLRWLENLKQSTALASNARKCVHIADREGDIFELFCTAEELGTHFVIRTCADRLSGDGSQCVSEKMERVIVKGSHWIEVVDKNGHRVPVLLGVKYRKLRVQPPIGKSKQYPSLVLTVIHAQEIGNPKDRDKINWKLITNLRVESARAAIEKINWYALRWKIEVFHKILKSGCKVEESKMRNAERLANLIAVFCILSWRIFWMTMIQRTDDQINPSVALTKAEITILDKLKPSPSAERSMATYARKIAMLGGYLARTNDPPPGNKVIWRGLTRLIDIELGFMLHAKIVGN